MQLITTTGDGIVVQIPLEEVRSIIWGFQHLGEVYHRTEVERKLLDQFERWYRLAVE